MVSSGCASRSLHIKVVNPLIKEIYASTKSTKNIEVGSIYRVYRSYQTHSTVQAGGGHAGHTGSEQIQHFYRKQVASIKIVKIIDENTVLVEVIYGDVEDGDTAEK